MITIIDCYTDEPAGLGVPPYIGTYPRYIYGSLADHDAADRHTDGHTYGHTDDGYTEAPIIYLTIDDLRLHKRYNSQIPETKPNSKTDIRVYNLTKNYRNVEDILAKTKTLIIILGVHVPGKYLTAVPGTLAELMPYIKGLKCHKILTGPAATEHGTQLEGGKIGRMPDTDMFEIRQFAESYADVAKAAVRGADLMQQIPDVRIAEIETGRGCTRKPGCSFCTEPLKHNLEFRDQKDIHAEIKALWKQGVRHFRLGKQSCFYSYKNGDPDEIEKLLKPIASLKPDVLHIDNANPAMVTEEVTKLIVKYCTEGNIAAFGVESFDPLVQEKNNLNCDNETVYKAVKILNKYGRERGKNGMPKFLPGINILFGLNGESKKTFEHNYFWLKRFLDEDLLLRRINIRQVAALPGTKLYSEAGNKYIKKNRKYYWGWRDRIRKDIDFPMLKKLVPAGTVLSDVRADVYDGRNTFCRQLGTYPLIVGVKERLELGGFYSLRITGHMLRSITGEVYRQS